MTFIQDFITSLAPMHRNSSCRFITSILKGTVKIGLTSAVALSAFGAVVPSETQPVLADRHLLEKIGAKIIATHEETDVSFAELNLKQQEQLTILAHEYGKCGGFEALPYQSGVAMLSPLVTHVFGQLSEQEAKNRRFVPSSHLFQSITRQPAIETALAQVSETNLRQTVEVLSSFKDRHHKSAIANHGVEALKARVDDTIRGSSLNIEVEYITHSGFPQKSLRARITGATRPNEIIVMGAHLDSINQSWMGRGDAPGADDNASGSANILETLRIMATQPRPERTIEFMWYAGEEGGLLGSADIAGKYKKESKQVVAVLQLDMTLFPGDGEFVLGSMTDFTSAWFRAYLEELNNVYIKARIVNDKCGYGCSDHASWYRQGYPTLMPFESTMNRMNKNLHTDKDRIDANSNFRHSAMFTKIALAIGMDLGNSTLKETP